MSQRRGLCCRMVERKTLGSKATESAPVVLSNFTSMKLMAAISPVKGIPFSNRRETIRKGREAKSRPN